MEDWLFSFNKINGLTDVKIYFGHGKRKDSLELFKNKSVLLVCSQRMENLLRNDDKFKDFFKKSRFIEIFHVNNYPELLQIEKELKEIKKIDFDSILAIGGGSVIDTAKIIKAFFNNERKSIRNLIGKKNILNKNKKFLELIAIPSTAGTGSEVTPYATLWDFEENKKYSISADFLIPDYAFIDPDLLENSPQNVLINTGFDAVNQAFDSIWNNSATIETIELAIISLTYGINSLPKIIDNQFNKKERYYMFLTSLCSGVCIAKTKTSICHSISYPITSYYEVPHGLACVFTMNAVLKMIYSSKKNIVKKQRKNVDELWLKKNKFNLLESIDIFVKKMEVSVLVKKYIKNLDDLMDIKNEMFTPGRIDNFIMPVDILDIEKILQDSWH